MGFLLKYDNYRAHNEHDLEFTYVRERAPIM